MFTTVLLWGTPCQTQRCDARPNQVMGSLDQFFVTVCQTVTDCKGLGSSSPRFDMCFAGLYARNTIPDPRARGALKVHTGLMGCLQHLKAGVPLVTFN